MDEINAVLKCDNLGVLVPAESASCTCCDLKQDDEADSCRFGAH